jgi:4-azaleucine resistance transporter AzlC
VVLVRSTLGDGAVAAVPICLGYVPIGLAFGVLARRAGLHPWQAGAMSLVVFAGSSQFIAVSMIGTGASAGAIAVTTFFVNLRHALMGSSLSLHLEGGGRRFLALFAHGITDESFAVNLGRFRDGGWDRGKALAVNAITCGAWILSSVAGALLGELIPPGTAGVDYALTAMFLCLLLYQIRGRIYAVTAALSGGVAVLFAVAGAGDSTVVVASLLGATMGYGLLRLARGGERAP